MSEGQGPRSVCGARKVFWLLFYKKVTPDRRGHNKKPKLPDRLNYPSGSFGCVATNEIHLIYILYYYL